MATQNSSQHPGPDLLKHPKLWRAADLNHSQSSRAATPSGFPDLDQHLQGRGWPAAGLMEILQRTTGIGELQLLAPALAQLSQTQRRWIAWIRPPFIPYAPALADLGIATDKILLIHPRDHQQALWALEQASKSGTCSMALAWLDESHLKPRETRRLQLAAQQGSTLTCLFRPETAASTASMAELRLRLQPNEPGTLALELLKRRGGWPLSSLNISLDQPPATFNTPAQAQTRARSLNKTLNQPVATPGHTVIEERKLQDIREQLLLWRHEQPFNTRQPCNQAPPGRHTRHQPLLEPEQPAIH